MSLDKTLFKALRAGGLGHKAALLLADPKSKYGFVGAGLAAEMVFAEAFVLTPTGVPLGGGFFPWDARYLHAQAAVALQANASVHFLFDRYDESDSPTPTPNGNAVLNITKMADGAGTPVAPVATQLIAYRNNGAWNGAQQGGFTIASVDATTVSVTSSSAGHYAIYATFTKAS